MQHRDEVEVGGVPRVTLPSREQYQRAINEWWGQGGGRSRLIVDALRRGEATVPEARAFAQRLAVRAAAGNSFMSAEMLDEQLEDTRAASAAKNQRLTPVPLFDADKCFFVAGVLCPQCTSLNSEGDGGPGAFGGMPIIHGALA